MRRDTVTRRLANPAARDPYVLAVALGIGAYAIAVAASTAIHLASPPDYPGVLPSVVTILGLLLVPASIFPSVLGSMFPRFWNATPVTLLNLAQLRSVLLLLAGAVTYALVAFLGTPLLAPDQQWLVVPVLTAAVIVATAMTVRLVGLSLAMLDPDRLSKYLHDTAARARDDGVARQALNDLARLIRGLLEAKRPTAAEHAITLLGAVGVARRDLLRGDERDLVVRVLAECRAAWLEPNRSPARDRALTAVDHVWKSLELEESPNPEATAAVDRRVTSGDIR